MTATVRPVDPDGDAALLTSWVTTERAAFWGMTGLGEEEVARIYRYIDDQEHLAAFLVLLDGHPLGLLQTYDPAVDEIGDWYPRQDGDVGMHLLLADDPARAGRTGEVLAAMLAFLTSLPGCRRLVLEPDARNEASLALLLGRLGARRGPLVDLRTSISEKPAQFCYLDRERALAAVAELRSVARHTREPVSE
ncbi:MULTISPECIES: GNAT family N-acetyltransferase [Nocardioides]|uniref:Lysine N-acyltransferase MbtK n=1 Tax=Nocardioides vastitatis TaxID=2568655 RepID=A0ABW0ZGQ0_9ACTN|nr:GNAT family N-acetyltransferase [Nocardioides sp.]THI91754.1 acetyltransferase [Nocardioides sp.]